MGYGDILPTQNLSRALLIPYVLIGVITLGLLIGSIRSLILERGRHRLDVRMVEKQRRKLVRSMTNKGRDEVLEPIREPYLSRASTREVRMNEYDRRRAEFLLMRKIQARSNRRRRWMAVAISTTVWMMLWLVGAAIFQRVEYPYQQWTYFDGFYFAFVTLLVCVRTSTHAGEVLMPCTDSWLRRSYAHLASWQVVLRLLDHAGTSHHDHHDIQRRGHGRAGHQERDAGSGQHHNPAGRSGGCGRPEEDHSAVIFWKVLPGCWR